MRNVNRRNLIYFENSSMRRLYLSMEEWQEVNNRRFLSISIQQDNGNYCCIALMSPAEVVITSADGRNRARVDSDGDLRVFSSHQPIH